MLSSYKYTKNIKIGTKALNNSTYYEVYATNPETGDELYIDGENFQIAIYEMLLYFETNDIKISTFALDIPSKYIIDDASREKIHNNQIKRIETMQKYIEETKRISNLCEKYRPCVDCKLNKKDCNDVIHYNCYECHSHRCPYMLKHLNIFSYLIQNHKTITKEEIQVKEKELSENKKITYHGV